jgi:hypothetical protein
MSSAVSSHVRGVPYKLGRVGEIEDIPLGRESRREKVDVTTLFEMRRKGG